MKKAGPVDDLKSLVFILLILFTNLAYAQPSKPIASSAKKTTFTISNPGLKLTIDTSGVTVRNLSADGLSLLFTKGLVFKFDIYGFNMSIQDIKKEYKEEESLVKIDNRHYLEIHSDSSSSKINSMSCWTEKLSFRPVPEFWTEMKNKKKLTSKELTVFANSDSDSWKKSENYINNYLFLPVSKKLVQVSVMYFYDGKTPEGLEGKVKELLQSITIIKKK